MQVLFQKLHSGGEIVQIRREPEKAETARSRYKPCRQGWMLELSWITILQMDKSGGM